MMSSAAQCCHSRGSVPLPLLLNCALWLARSRTGSRSLRRSRVLDELGDRAVRVALPLIVARRRIRERLGKPGPVCLVAIYIVAGHTCVRSALDREVVTSWNQIGERN